MSNGDAFESTLTVLEELGRIERVDVAQVEAVRSLASAVDEHPEVASLWRQYREALAELVRTDDDADGSLEAALEALRSATPVGDQTPS